MKYTTDFTVIDNRPIGDHYFSLTLQHPAVLPPITAGQFVEVKVDNCPEVMLRRPISIYDVSQIDNTLSLLIQKVGKGTRKLSTLSTGAKVNMLYPLGNGFSMNGKNVLLVGGGAGVAPLFYLARCFSSQGVTPTILLGGRTANLIPDYKRFEQVGNLSLATEDGSLGEKGFVTNHSAYTKDYDAIYACGPTPMLKAVARDARAKGIRCEVSLENTMACGLGACLCCVCKTDQGHKCVCSDGPVFNITSLNNWMDE